MPKAKQRKQREVQRQKNDVTSSRTSTRQRRLSKNAPDEGTQIATPPSDTCSGHIKENGVDIQNKARVREWGYQSENGPDTWAEFYPDSNGNQQSPIDINTNEVMVKSFEPVTWSGFGDDAPYGATMKLINNGHSVQVCLTGDYFVSGGGLPGPKYKAIQFHFHFGKCDNRGSEHRIDGTEYAAEMHIVSYNTKYPDANRATTESDGLAVFGVLIKVGATDNEAFDDFLGGIDRIQYRDDVYSFERPFSIAKLMPENTTSYYRYSGSLTTPPCAESVLWTVFKQTVSISVGQINKLRNVFASKRGESELEMADNYRPPQPLCGRTVYTSV